MPAPRPVRLTVDRLKEMLDYSAQTGEFRWKVSPAPRVRAGDIAGGKVSNGHSHVMLDWVSYPAHRLAWMYETGEWPMRHITHLNGDKRDNRFANLSITKLGKEKIREVVSLDRLKSRIDYNPETGRFRWKVAESGRQSCDVDAGGYHGCGYITISFDGVRYLAHRLAWFYINGTWPKMIDHINGDRKDNRIVNLREVTPAQNGHNASKRSTNTTGHKGVFRTKSGKYYARLTANNITVSSKRFETKEEAVEAAGDMIASLHGEFAKETT